jgi:hypothetical protein
MRRHGAAIGAIVLACVVAVTGCSAQGTTVAPPWLAPTDRAARAHDAGLRNVWGEKLAEHIHTHLTITDDGLPVTVPAHIGLSEPREFAAQLHTHDTSGIVHVESPNRHTFTLGQFFTEWDVALGPDRVGGLRGELTVWVDGRRAIGNPASIPLRDLEQIDLVVTTLGHVPHRPAAFVWPPQYH